MLSARKFKVVLTTADYNPSPAKVFFSLVPFLEHFRKKGFLLAGETPISQWCICSKIRAVGATIQATGSGCVWELKKRRWALTKRRSDRPERAWVKEFWRLWWSEAGCRSSVKNSAHPILAWSSPLPLRGFCSLSTWAATMTGGRGRRQGQRGEPCPQHDGRMTSEVYEKDMWKLRRGWYEQKSWVFDP